VKFGYYRACPTIQEYVLIATKYQAVEVYRRTEQGWTAYRAYGPDDDLELESIGIRFPVATLYKRTDVPAMPPDHEGEV
jgi:Uma2 family endonuclease